MQAKITFYGGAGTVTGSNFMLETESTKILIDCGAHERENICDPKNHDRFAYDASSVNALLVTHAHQDHIGRIPKLIAEGFKGVIYSTAATKEISMLMFQDALHVMAEDALRSGCGVLFSEADVAKTLSLWQVHDYHKPFSIGDLKIEFLNAGHILGSAMMRISGSAKRSVIFTGDLGNSPEPLLPDTETPEGVNYLVMESVYGDKVHENRDERVDILRNAIEEARKHGGTLLIPSFSIERTQILLYEIHRLVQEGKMERIPVYLDAPLAERINDVFRAHHENLNEEARQEFTHGDIFSFPGLVEVMKSAHSSAIHDKPDPKVIIAGAGMSNGGRIRAHEKRCLADPNASILFTGYQAPGSLGRRIEGGEKQVTIDGEKITVRATIGSLTGFSGHKDRDGLLQFVESAGPSLEKAFVVMGEPKSSMFLAQRIKDFLDKEAVVPHERESAEIEL